MALTALLTTACTTRVAISDEPPVINAPDAPLVCPSGSIKRVAAKTFRELDPVRLADATIEQPTGYVPPRMLVPPRVRYPGHLLSRKPGFVAVAVVISREGNVGKPRVVCSSDTAFEEAALDSVATMRIQPATLHGVPHEEIAIIPIRFVVE
ncbi:MAG: energy transducer TonB [Gammaproteobacteria bacterium]|nr:energy transducer TonB [Gammaproteobacteria bacterium]